MAGKPRVALCIGHCIEVGRLVIGRCYGNGESLTKWAKASSGYQLLPRHALPCATKRNASDFALTIEVVALLQSKGDYLKGHKQLSGYLKKSGIFEIKDKLVYVLDK
jgi:hypothetical protein